MLATCRSEMLNRSVQRLRSMERSGPSVQQPSGYDPGMPSYCGSAYGTSYNTPMAFAQGNPRPSVLQGGTLPSLLTHAAAGSTWGNVVGGTMVLPPVATGYPVVYNVLSSPAVPPGVVVSQQLVPPQGSPTGDYDMRHPL